MNTMALVTGASSGIGRECARQLAARGYGVILVARREERLKELRAEIHKNFGVSVEIFCMDLAQPDAADRLFAEVQAKNLHVEVLINNAGFGIKRGVQDCDRERISEMIALNIQTLTRLTLMFGESFRKNQKGYILQVSSIAAFLPCPGMAIYAATKAYVQSFGEALAYEWKPYGVLVTTLSPGTTLTEFFEVAGQNVKPAVKKLGLSPERVATIGLNALFAGRERVTPGFLNIISLLFIKLMPRWLVVRLAGSVVKKAM